MRTTKVDPRSCWSYIDLAWRSNAEYGHQPFSNDEYSVPEYRRSTLMESGGKVDNK